MGHQTIIYHCDTVFHWQIFQNQIVVVLRAIMSSPGNVNFTSKSKPYLLRACTCSVKWHDVCHHPSKINWWCQDTPFQVIMCSYFRILSVTLTLIWKPWRNMKHSMATVNICAKSFQYLSGHGSITAWTKKWGSFFSTLIWRNLKGVSWLF